MAAAHRPRHGKGNAHCLYAYNSNAKKLTSDLVNEQIAEHYGASLGRQA